MTGFVFHTRSAAATRALGARLGKALRPGTVLLLEGDLGAGKTTLVQGLAEAIGVGAGVTSPTFTLVREYRCRLGDGSAQVEGRLVHMDFYRLTDRRSVVDLGLDDDFDGQAVVVIEWPQRASGALPTDALRIELAREPAGTPQAGRTAGGDEADRRDEGPSEADAPGESDEPRRLTLTAGGLRSVAVLADLLHTGEATDVAGD